MILYRVSTQTLDWSQPHGSLKSYVKQVNVDRCNGKSVWINGKRFARATNDSFYADTELSAYEWLHEAWLARADEHSLMVDHYQRAIQLRNDWINTLNDKVKSVRQVVETFRAEPS